jgi:hypothetical protein
MGAMPPQTNMPAPAGMPQTNMPAPGAPATNMPSPAAVAPNPALTGVYTGKNWGSGPPPLALPTAPGISVARPQPQPMLGASSGSFGGSVQSMPQGMGLGGGMTNMPAPGGMTNMPAPGAPQTNMPAPQPMPQPMPQQRPQMQQMPLQMPGDEMGAMGRRMRAMAMR